jgi:hypothetical protein
MIGWAAEQYYALLTVEGTSSTVAAKLVALGTGLVLAAAALAVLHYLRPWFDKQPSQF